MKTEAFNSNSAKKPRLLAILGSPNKDGLNAKMLSICTKAAKHAGWQVDIIDLYDKNIAFCHGCDACMKLHTCAFAEKDDMAEIIELLRACDMVALAAPIYWANVPGVVKNLFDRLRGVAMEETVTFPKALLSGKKYLFFTSCNTASPFAEIFGQTGGIKRAVHEFFKTAGIKCNGTFICTNAKKQKDVPEKLKQKISHYWEKQ